MAAPHQAAPTRRSSDRRALDGDAPARTRRSFDRQNSYGSRRGSAQQRGSQGSGNSAALLSMIPSAPTLVEVLVDDNGNLISVNETRSNAPSRRASGQTMRRRSTDDDEVVETDPFDPETHELLQRGHRKLLTLSSVASDATVAGSSLGEGQSSRQPSKTKSAIESSQQPKRLDSVMSMNPDAKRIYQMMIGDRPHRERLAPKAEKLKGDVTSLVWNIPAPQQPMEEDKDNSSGIEPRGEVRKPILPIFSHKGVWVRPSSVGTAIEPLQSLVHAPPIEEHAGVIDGTVQVDVAHAILAFDFIDCINDDVLHHYLPDVDKSLSQDLGLRHNAYRLSIPGSERVQPESVGESYDCAYSEGYSYDQSYDQSSSNEYGHVGATSVTPTKEQGSWVDSCEERSDIQSGDWESEQLGYVEEPSCTSHLQTEQLSGDAVSNIPQGKSGQHLDNDSTSERHSSKQEISVDPTTVGPSWETSGLEADSASGTSLHTEPIGNGEHRQRNNSTRSSKIIDLSYGGDFLQLETVNSPEAQVWPHACSIFPKSLSQTRSNKLRAVDSMPSRAFDFYDSKSETPTPMDSTFQTIRAGGWPTDASFGSSHGSKWFDPASTSAPTSSVYSHGASRVRGLGQFRRQRSCPKPQTARSGKRRPKPGPASMVDNSTSSASLQCTGDVAEKALAARQVSRDSKASMELAQASVGIASAQGSANIPTTTDAKSPGTRREEDQLVSNDNLGDLLSMHLQGEASIPQGERATKEQCLKANPTCPFSHDSMDSSVSISLRCGHRFALSHMEIARSGPSVCASAGFASKDALICPLCGDQDVTTTPEGSSMITTYSTNTAAYLGELKKDWQWNLLPMQDPITSMPKDSGEESRKGRSFLPSILSARKA